MSSPILYPNVTSLPGSPGVDAGEKAQPKKQEGQKSDFDHAFDKAITTSTPASKSNPTEGGKSLDQVKAPLKFSAHASQRLQERKIALDAGTLAKVNDAVDKAESKGVEDTLVLTKDAALIVSVKNRTVITAMDRGQLTGNVFTNIDGAVVV